MINTKFSKAYSEEDIKKLNINALEQFNWELLQEGLEVINEKTSLLDALNRIKYNWESHPQSYQTFMVYHLLSVLISLLVDSGIIHQQQELHNRVSVYPDEKL